MITGMSKSHAVTRVRVFVTPKRDVLDPQGEAVARALHRLGFPGSPQVRVGKCIDIELQGTSEEDARLQADAMCKKLLANPVMEDYHFEVQ